MHGTAYAAAKSSKSDEVGLANMTSENGVMTPFDEKSKKVMITLPPNKAKTIIRFKRLNRSGRTRQVVSTSLGAIEVPLRGSKSSLDISLKKGEIKTIKVRVYDSKGEKSKTYKIYVKRLKSWPKKVVLKGGEKVFIPQTSGYFPRAGNKDKCEIIANVMMAQYDGYKNVTVAKILGAIPRSGNPWRGWIGYGCYYPPMVKTLKKYVPAKHVKYVGKQSLNKLCRKYIANGYPVAIWASIYMGGLGGRRSNGYIGNTHCLTLVGYDENSYYFLDSMKGAYVKYSKRAVERAYNGQGQQAIVITQKKL
ncbi:MAG: C39 family peptidase [Candidatus Nomurabacteria bacterium]|nr:C39 family peptidase [Candidatus Nomurabacteria bacterium]